MARDYVKKVNKKPSKKSSSRRRVPSRQDNSSNNGLWLLALLLVVLFVGGLIYIKQHHVAAPEKEAATVSAVSAKKSAAKKGEATPKPVAAAPQFDFYTELPKAQANLSSPVTKTSVTYIVQLGVFKAHAAADAFKARVVLLGFEVNIKSIKKGADTSYRVWMGPYKTKAEAQQQQYNLQNKQLKSQLLKQE